MLEGTPRPSMISLTAATASLSETPIGRLNDRVVATNNPWWLMASGMLPGAKCATALSGTMASAFVLTAEPVEAAPLPVLPMELSAKLRAASSATAAEDEAGGEGGAGF